MSAREKEHGGAGAVHPRRPRTSSMSHDSSRHATPDKGADARRPLSPVGAIGGVKKAAGGKQSTDYQQLKDSNEGTTTRGGAPPPAHTHDEEAPAPPSFVNESELAQGGIEFNNMATTPARPTLNGSTNGAVLTASNAATNNAHATRTRSMSGAAGHPARHTRRASRRGSVLVDGVLVAREKKPKPQGHYTKQPVWILGLVCVILGSILDFAALAFVDQAVVAPLGSLTLVSNVFFAPLLLGEKVNRKQLYCTALIISGSCLAVAFAPHSDSTLKTDEMFHEFIRARFIVYGILCILAVVGLRVICWRCNKVRRADPHGAYTKVARYHTFAYAACAGIMGAQSVLFAKCTAMLLKSSFAGDGVMFAYPGTYGVLIGLGVTIFLQIRWLNSGLRMFTALMIVPIFQSFWILVSVIAGMIFFGEYAGVFEHTTNAIMFPFGLFLTICGVYFLTQIKSPSSENAEAGHGHGHATGVQHRRRSRSSARSSISLPHGSLQSVVVEVDSNASTNGGGGVAASGSTPLMKSLGDSYGVPSPRDPSILATTVAATPRKPTRVQGPPRAGGINSTADGGFSEATPRPEDGEEYDSGSESGSSSEEEDHVQENLEIAQHLAPLNSLMYFLPDSLIREPSTPTTTQAYFEENSSGFGNGGEDSTIGGLPYERIFRIAPVQEDDEESLSRSGSVAASPVPNRFGAFAAAAAAPASNGITPPTPLSRASSASPDIFPPNSQLQQGSLQMSSIQPAPLEDRTRSESEEAAEARQEQRRQKRKKKRAESMRNGNVSQETDQLKESLL